MWPMLLDMSRMECKKSLRALELEAYASVVSAFRAQGDLTAQKIEILKDLQLEFKISIDRHKAELRRANNDEKLYTIAKRLSHGECVSSEWNKQSKRLIPLLPRLEYQSHTNDYYRILADHIVSKSRPILNLYPESNNVLNNNNNEQYEKEQDNLLENNLNIHNGKKMKKKKQLLNDDNNNNHMNVNTDSLDDELRPLDDEKNLLYLSNGFAVDSNNILVQNIKPSEYAKKHESITNESSTNSLIKLLLQKHNQHQIEKENLNKQIENLNNLVDSKNSNQLKIESTPIQLQQHQQITIDQTKYIYTEQKKLYKTDNNNIIPTATPINIKNINQYDTNSLTFLTASNINQPAKLISQQQQQSNTLRPPTTLKVATTTTTATATPATTQMIKLTPTSTPTSTPSQLISNIPIISPATANTPTILNPYPLNQTSQTSTIVKLTPTQINFNNINCPISKTTTQTANSTQSPQFKHLVVPKPNQKLIILPNQNNNDILNTNGTTTLKQTNNQTSVSKNGLINSSPLIVTNNQNTSSDITSKLFMYNHQSPQQSAKNLKILTTTSTNPTTSSTTNKIVLNVANSTFKLSSPTILTPTTTSIIDHNLNNGHNENNTAESLKRKHSLSVSEEERFHIKRINVITNETSLSSVCSPKSPSSVSSTTSSSMSSSPPNWSESNLQFIKDMLSKLNTNNNINSNLIIKDEIIRQINETRKDDEALREMCETIKEKIEKNAYETVEDLNNDIDSIKEKYVIQSKSDNNRMVIKLNNNDDDLVDGKNSNHQNQNEITNNNSINIKNGNDCIKIKLINESDNSTNNQSQNNQGPSTTNIAIA